MAPALAALLRQQVDAARSVGDARIATTKAALGLAGLAGKIQEAFNDLSISEFTERTGVVGDAAASTLRLQTATHSFSALAFRTMQGKVAASIGLLLLLVLLCVLILWLVTTFAARRSRGNDKWPAAISKQFIQTPYRDGSPMPSNASSRTRSPQPSFSGLAPPYSDTLCSELLVNDPAGMAIIVHGAIMPHFQDEVFEVVECHDENALVARLYLLEKSQAGILVESALRSPIALINTAGAVAALGEAPPARRHVTISARSPFRGQEDDVKPFAVAQHEHGKVVVRGAGSDSPVLYTVTEVGPQSNIVDASGREVASVSPYGNGMIIRVAPGADGGMILCIVVAERKLRDDQCAAA